MIAAAIVGLGRWGHSFVESVQGRSNRIQFVRGVDTAPQAAREFAARHGIPLTDDFGAVLADPSIQAVVLATPHSLHRLQVIAAAEAGKQVFCEKPLALTAADARAMTAACTKAGVVLGVGHNRRFWPAIRELRRIVASGELGELMHIEGHNSNENSNRVQDGWRLRPEEWAGCLIGIFGIGLLNFLVSFGLSLALSLRSRKADLQLAKDLVWLVMGHFFYRPGRFFFPPKAF